MYFHNINTRFRYTFYTISCCTVNQTYNIISIFIENLSQI